MWDHHQISTLNTEELVDKVIALSLYIENYITEFVEGPGKKEQVVVHFHEWMASVALLALKHKKTNIVFKSLNNI